ALDAGELGSAHHTAELAVPGAIAGQQAKARAIGEDQLGADDRLDTCLVCRLGELDRAVEAAAIAQAEGAQAEPGGGRHQGARRGGPLQEGVVGADSQLSERPHLTPPTLLCKYPYLW